MNVHIRPATEADAQSLFSLASALSTSFTVEEQRFLRVFQELLNSRSALVLVAEYGQKLLGYALGFTHATFYANGHVGWVEEIFVKEEFRRLNVGRQLMQSIETWVQERGCALIALATRRASTFYKSIGYEESATYFRKLM